MMRKKIRALAGYYGIRVFEAKRRSDALAGWSGKAIIAGGLSDSNLIHDIAHWLVAEPKRRTIPDFGLGPAPDVWHRDRRTRVYVSMSKAQEEEECASVLGILIEKDLGMDYRDTYADHSWDLSESFAERARQVDPIWREVRPLIRLLRA